MFKIKFGTLNNNEFANALDALSKKSYDVKTSYTIAKISRLCMNATKEGMQEYTKILKKHCELDEKGNLKPKTIPAVMKDGVEVTPAKTLAGTFVVKPENKEAFDKDVEDFLSIEVPIEWNMIDLDSLMGEKIEPWILEELDSIISTKNTNLMKLV